jgi:hypothetical protein
MGATHRNSRSPGRLHQQSVRQPHCRPTPAASKTVVTAAVRTYKVMRARSGRRTTPSLGIAPGQEGRGAALGIAASDKHDATGDPTESRPQIAKTLRPTLSKPASARPPRSRGNEPRPSRRPAPSPRRLELLRSVVLHPSPTRRPPALRTLDIEEMRDKTTHSWITHRGTDLDASPR